MQFELSGEKSCNWSYKRNKSYYTHDTTYMYYLFM